MDSSRFREDVVLKDVPVYRDMAACLDDGVVVVNTDGIVVHVNPAAADIFGFAPDEMTGMDIDCLFGADNGCRRMMSDSVDSSEEPAVARCDVTCIGRDGLRTRCRHTVAPVRDDDGGTVAWMNILRRAEDPAGRTDCSREAGKRYRVVTRLLSNHEYSFQVNPEGVLELEWVEGDYAGITGYPSDELQSGVGWQDLVHPHDREIAQERFARLMSGERDVSDFRIVTRTGEVRWLRDYAEPEVDPATGRVVRIVGAAQDITERRRVRTLMTMQRKLALALSGANDADEVYNLTLDHAVGGDDFECGGVWRRRTGDGSFVLAARRGLSDEYASLVERFTAQCPHVGLFMKDGPSMVQYDDVITRPDDVRRREGLKAMLVVPVRSAGEVVAAMVLANRTGATVQEEATEIFQSVAVLVGNVLERIRVMEELSRSEERYRTLVEGADDGIVLSDLDGRHIYRNRAYLRNLGYEEGDPALEHPETLIHPGDLVSVRAAMRELHRRGAISFEYRVRTKRGAWKHSSAKSVLLNDTGGRPMSVMTIVRDITDLKMIETALIREHAKMETLLNYKSLLADVATLLNSHDRFADVLDNMMGHLRESLDIDDVALYCFHHLSRDIVCGKVPFGIERSFSLLCGRDALGISSRLFEKFSRGERVIITSMTDAPPEMRGMLGAPEFSAAVALPIKSAGTVLGVLVFRQRNIYVWSEEEFGILKTVTMMIANSWERYFQFTARIEAERRQAVTASMLERSSHLASIGRLAAGIAHEINQPLTALKVTVDGILYRRSLDVDDGEVVADDIEFIAEQASRIDEIIRHMRALAHQDRLDTPAPVDMNSQVDRALSVIRHQLRAHGIEIVLDLDAGLPPILGYGTQVQQVVTNLIANAMHAIDSSDPERRCIFISTWSEGETCCLRVEDTGPGIPEKDINRLFDPFFTTGMHEGGMGLGLTITFNIVNASGGRIEASNRNGGGASFTVSLPALPDGGPTDECIAG